MDQTHAAANARGGKTGEIADDAAAQRQDTIAPFEPSGDDPVANLLEAGIGFRSLARRDDDARMPDMRHSETIFKPRQMMARDIVVGDDGDRRVRRQPGDVRPGFSYEASPIRMS